MWSVNLNCDKCEVYLFITVFYLTKRTAPGEPPMFAFHFKNAQNSGLKCTSLSVKCPSCFLEFGPSDMLNLNGRKRRIILSWWDRIILLYYVKN